MSGNGCDNERAPAKGAEEEHVQKMSWIVLEFNKLSIIDVLKAWEVAISFQLAMNVMRPFFGGYSIFLVSLIWEKSSFYDSSRKVPTFNLKQQYLTIQYLVDTGSWNNLNPYFSANKSWVIGLTMYNTE